MKKKSGQPSHLWMNIALFPMAILLALIVVLTLSKRLACGKAWIALAVCVWTQSCGVCPFIPRTHNFKTGETKPAFEQVAP
jgi:hypothetical protein